MKYIWARKYDSSGHRKEMSELFESFKGGFWNAGSSTLESGINIAVRLLIF